MLRDSAVAIVAQRLGNRTDLDTRIVTEMQQVQSELEQGKFLPWFLIYTDTALANEASQTDTILEPTGFILPVDDVELEYLDSVHTKWLVVHKLASYDMLQSANISQFNYNAQMYAVRGSDMILFPDPGKVLSFRWSYYKAALSLATNIENSWLEKASELVIALTCLKLASTLQMEPTMLAVYEAMANAADLRLQTLNEAKVSAGTNMVMQYGNGAT